MKPYGQIGIQVCPTRGNSVSDSASALDIQDLLPKGTRVRRKKHKRRLQIKSTRSKLRQRLNKFGY